MSHAPRTTRYKPQAWSTRDTLLALFSAVTLAAVIAITLLEPQLFAFYPYPRVALPPFDARLGLGLSLLSAPAFMRPREGRQSVAQSVTAAGK